MSSPKTKEASALVYLVEELGDARLLSDQLLRYIQRAVQLVEKSSKKDHFFEVAGDILEGLPATAVKLDKALKAVALATNRIDYEEVRQDLRPEKVDELERVLDEVRVRPIRRRGNPMNPQEVIQKLRSLAASARRSGQVPSTEVFALIAALEGDSPKTASDGAEKFARGCESMADALKSPPEGVIPSRIRLAYLLRQTVASEIDITASRYSNDPKWITARYPGVAEDGTPFRKGEKVLYWPRTKVFMVGAKAEAAYRKFEAEIADEAFAGYGMDYSASQQQDEDEGYDKTAVYESREVQALNAKTLSASKALDDAVEDLKTVEKLMKSAPAWVQISSDLDRGGIGKLIKGIESLRRQYLGWGGLSFVDKTASDPTKTARFSGRPADLFNLMKKAVDDLLNARVKIRDIHEILQQLKEDATGLSPFDDVYNAKDITRVRDTLYELDHQIGKGFNDIEWLEKQLRGRVKKASEYEEREARFEEGVPADPTENMSPEDAEEWKANTEEYGDKFKKEASSVRWIERDNNLGHRWLADVADANGDTWLWQIVEFQGPGIPLYRVMVMTPDGVQMKWKKQPKKLEEAQRFVEAWAKASNSGASLIMTKDFVRVAAAKAPWETGETSDNPMRKYPNESAARQDAKSRGLYYGFSAFSDGWYVGTEKQLKGIGVSRAKQAMDRTASLKPKDQKVVEAFASKKSLQGDLLGTDGKELKYISTKNTVVAMWVGDVITRGDDSGSKTDDEIMRYLKKVAPKSDLKLAASDLDWKA